jgi:hypothetical protein
MGRAFLKVGYDCVGKSAEWQAELPRISQRPHCLALWIKPTPARARLSVVYPIVKWLKRKNRGVIKIETDCAVLRKSRIIKKNVNEPY